MKVLLNLGMSGLLLLSLSSCRKNTIPEVSNQELAQVFIAELKAHPRQHCVRTAMMGYVEDGATWLIRADNGSFSGQQVAADFRNKLLLMEGKGWFRIQRFNNPEVGEYWKVFYTQQARKRFNIEGFAPVRKDQVQRLCFGGQKATYLEKQGPVELVNGVPRVMVSYRVKAVSLPEWASDPELDDVLWQKPPSSEEAGTVRMYVGQDDKWMVDPTFASPMTAPAAASDG